MPAARADGAPGCYDPGMRTLLPVMLVLAGCLGGGRGDDVRFVPDTAEDPTFQGIVEVAPQALEITAQAGGPFAVGTVEVRNVGEYPLELITAELVEDGDDALVTDEATNAGRTISPERSFEVLIRCTLPAADTDTPDTDGPASAAVEGLLQVRTNDPATPEVDVPVTCVDG